LFTYRINRLVYICQYFLSTLEKKKAIIKNIIKATMVKEKKALQNQLQHYMLQDEKFKAYRIFPELLILIS